MVAFPTNSAVEAVGLPEDRLAKIQLTVMLMPRTGLHLAEIISEIYSRHISADPLDQVCVGFLGAAQTLLETSLRESYTIWRGSDPEWATGEKS